MTADPDAPDVAEPRAGGTVASLLDHVAVASRDADRTASWFERTLGLRRAREEVVEDAGVRLVWLYPAGRNAGGPAAATQIVQPLREGPVARHLDEHGEGLHHVCFAVPDLARSLDDLAESADQVFTGGYGYPCAFLRRQPPGCAIELVERPA
ncbi:VOC family protein [Streptomyces sp. B6B3]|uniref:VOC family protein n=1 Tax=Streptomyces sp. B6B3 TaxID=3153570 RepID=UPI00325EE48F